MASGLWSWLLTWDTAIGAFGSIGVSALLVALYAKQHGLLKQELNREMRINHTETLKKRIRAWHGDIDDIGVSNKPPTEENSNNLPTVYGASVDPAPAVMNLVGREDEFRVVPETLEDDQYLQDLLNNHATELKELKQSIESQYEAFEYARNSFLEEFPGGETIETEHYTLQPMDFFSEWVFKRAVKLHRSQVDTSKEREKDIAETRLRGTNSADPEKAAIRYSPVGEGGISTYEAVIASGDLHGDQDHEDEFLDDLIELHFEAIDDIDDTGVYEHAVEAAEILDEMNIEIEELRAKLVEYEGHPLFTGDCPYLDEASV